MKISQKQANLLAREIVSKLKEKKVQKASDSLIAQVKKFTDVRMALNKKKAAVVEEINRHDATLRKIVGNLPNLYACDSVNKIIEKVEEKNMPRVQEIEDEIILKAMFKSEDDLETFVNAIVKKYEKKLSHRILVN